MKDLVMDLVESSGKWNEKELKVVLPNIPGQRYVFGPVYPGERQGEEFIRTRTGLLDPIYGTIISVDDQGQFWIQNDTRTVEMTRRSSFYNLFVNEERVTAVGKGRLKSGDTISLGDPGAWRGPGRESPLDNNLTYREDQRPVLLVSGLRFCMGSLLTCLESVIGSSGSRQIEGNGTGTDTESEALGTVMNGLGLGSGAAADSPLYINLILEKIMSYLPFNDLKAARLVCKKWREEASIPFEKRGKVSFFFRDDGNRANSTMVLRYLHEMRDLKIQNLKIRLDPTEYGEWSNYSEKIVDDLRKLLKSSHNFCTLSLKADITTEADFIPFSLIFHELGGKLVELALGGYHIFLPEVVPPLPLMTTLKKFAHYPSLYHDDEGNKLRMVSLLVPLFSKGLEYFSCTKDLADSYLQAFLTQHLPKLRGIAIRGWANSAEILSPLLALKNPLTSLEIECCYPESEEEVEILEKILLKHSPSLQTLVIKISHIDEIKFPPFQKLEKFSLTYFGVMGVSWDTDLDYEEQFPSLRKLTISSRGRWREDDPVFNAFFPEERNLRSETLKDVWIPVLPCYDSPLPETGPFQQRMDQIMKMFPNAEKINFSQ